MGLFGFIKKKKGASGPQSPALPMMKDLERKPIYEFKMLEVFTIADIEEILANQDAFGACRLIEETDKYWFYGFTPRLLKYLSGEYVLRRSKATPTLVQFFGKSSEYACVFGDFLCQVDHDASRAVICKNIESGETTAYSWFRPSESVEGHFYQYDHINKMFVDGDRLIFDVGRYKGDFHNCDDSYNYTAEYFLVVKQENGVLHATKQTVLRNVET